MKDERVIHVTHNLHLHVCALFQVPNVLVSQKSESESAHDALPRRVRAVHLGGDAPCHWLAGLNGERAALRGASYCHREASRGGRHQAEHIRDIGEDQPVAKVECPRARRSGRVADRERRARCPPGGRELVVFDDDVRAHLLRRICGIVGEEGDAAAYEDVVADLDVARALGARELDATPAEAHAVYPPQVGGLAKLGGGAVDVAAVVAGLVIWHRTQGKIRQTWDNIGAT